MINGQINISLPTFFPTPTQPLDPNNPNIELHVNLANPSTPIPGQPDAVPNPAAALQNVSLNNIMGELVNGWDGMMQFLQSDLTQLLAAQNLPIVGTPLQHAFGFLQQINNKVTEQLQQAPNLAATAVQQGLFDALGPGGLNILVPVSGSGVATVQDVVLTYLDSSGNPVTNASQANAVHFLVHLQDAVNEVLSAGGGFGLPGLGLSFNGSLDLAGKFTATLGFGLAKDAGFYVDSSDQASLGFGVSLTGNATATLGFLQLQVTNPNPEILAGSLGVNLKINPDQYGRVSLAHLANLGASNFSYGLGVDPSLKLDAGLANLPDLPDLSTTLAFTWNVHSTGFDTQAFLAATGIDLTQSDGLTFSDVTLDMGTFFTDIANKIGDVFKPIEPLAQVLTTPLPVLSQLAGQPVDLIGLATALGLCGEGTGEFVNDVAQFISHDPLASLEGSFDLGSFTLDPSAVQNPADDGNLQFTSETINSQTQQAVSSDLQSVDSDLQSGTTGGFQVPILSDPASAFQLLLGKSVPLFTYTTPALELDFGFSQFFPVIGPLGVNLMGQMGVSGQLSFGFDTSGFQEYAADGFSNPSQILDGLYVDANASQLTLDGSIAAYAAVDLGILSAGVGGGLFATISLNPYDPSGTGHVHLQQLESDIQKGTIFSESGSLQAFLDAYVTLDLGVFSHTWTFDIAHVTLATLSQSPQVQNTTPVLATMQTDTVYSGTQQNVLRLNIGSFAADRLYQSTTNSSKATVGNEALTVVQGPNSNSVYIYGCGVPQSQELLYTFPANGLPDVIVAAGAQGDDTVDTVSVNVTSNINVNLVAGAGTNTFDVSTSGRVTLTGGSGNGDVLEVDAANGATLNGGSGSETLKVTHNVPAVLNAGSGANTLDASADSASVVLIGGTGNDTLFGGSGTGDLLFADGAVQQNGSWIPVAGFNPSKQDLLVAGSGTSQLVFGGAGSDVLIGGSGPYQQLIAGPGNNQRLFGGTGANQTVGANVNLLAGSGSGVNDQYFANSNADQTLVGGSGAGALLAVGWNLDSNYKETSGIMPTGWQVNSKGQWTAGDNQDGVDFTPNASGAPHYHNYTMYAGSGNNTMMFGGLGNALMFGSVGTVSMYGGGGPGVKQLYAGTGNSNLYGGSPLGGATFSFTNAAGALFTLSYASTGPHYLYGGPGQDELYGGDGISVGLTNLAGDDMDTQGQNYLYGGSGANVLWGDGTRPNQLYAGTGNDTMNAGTGGDLLVAGTGVDVLQGGPGNDTFELPFNPVTGTTLIPDAITGDGGIDTVSFLGSSLNPEIYMTVQAVGTATGTISGHTITNLSDFSGSLIALTSLVAGEMVTGPGIQPNTTIDSIDFSAGTINLSNNVAGGGSVSLTFSKYVATLSDVEARRYRRRQHRPATSSPD